MGGEGGVVRKGGIVSTYIRMYMAVAVEMQELKWGLEGWSGVGRGEVSEAGTNGSGCEENGRDLAPLPLPLQR